MSALSIILTVIGFVGLSGVAGALGASRRLTRQNRLLRFGRGDLLEVVLPTSERGPGGLGVTYIRPTTAVGNMRGAVEIARMVGHVSRRRVLSVAVSEDIESDLSGDLVLIGLPGKNAASKRVLERLKSHHPEINFAISEPDQSNGHIKRALKHLKSCHPDINLHISEAGESGVRIGLGGFREDFKLTFQASSDIPDRDLAVIVLWINPFASGKKRRLLLCAGITAYGTAAAAAYIVNDLVDYRYHQLRKARKGALPSLLSVRHWACFAMVVEVLLQNDQAIDLIERSFVVLPDPGRPPWD